MFSSKNFLSYYKVFLGFKMAYSGPGSGPGLLNRAGRILVKYRFLNQLHDPLSEKWIVLLMKRPTRRLYCCYCEYRW